MSKLIKMFFPSRRTSDLGGNGGCGGMVSVLLLAIGLALLLAAPKAFGAEERWQPRIIITMKEGTLLLFNRNVFPDEDQCKLYLSANADAIKTMVDKGVGDALVNYDASCAKLVEERAT